MTVGPVGGRRYGQVAVLGIGAGGLSCSSCFSGSVAVLSKQAATNMLVPHLTEQFRFNATASQLRCRTCGGIGDRRMSSSDLHRRQPVTMLDHRPGQFVAVQRGERRVLDLPAHRPKQRPAVQRQWRRLPTGSVRDEDQEGNPVVDDRHYGDLICLALPAVAQAWSWRRDARGQCSGRNREDAEPARLARRGAASRQPVVGPIAVLATLGRSLISSWVVAVFWHQTARVLASSTVSESDSAVRATSATWRISGQGGLLEPAHPAVVAARADLPRLTSVNRDDFLVVRRVGSSMNSRAWSSRSKPAL